MILVEADQVRPRSVFQQHNSPIENVKSELEEQMENVMNRRGITAYEKLRLFNDLHLQYLEYTNRSQNRSTIPTQPSPVTNPRLGNIPPRFKTRADEILEWVKGRPDVLGWDAETAEATYKGKKLPGSNISDLIRDTVVPNPRSTKRELDGEEEFWRGLAEINVPLSLLRKRGVPPPPPPPPPPTVSSASSTDRSSSDLSPAMASALEGSILNSSTPIRKKRTDTPRGGRGGRGGGRGGIAAKPPIQPQHGGGRLARKKRVTFAKKLARGRPSWLSL